MVYDREEAARRAEASDHNKPGFCQQWTREMFGAPSVGDVDSDNDADAMDGWKSEPPRARHVGDRRPPRGVPVTWSGGPNGFGHRAVSLGNGMIRSTDAAGAGGVGTVPLGWVEANWGLNYLGWSETISGLLIPEPKPPVMTRGPRIDVAIRRLKRAKAAPGTPRRNLIDRALVLLQKIKRRQKKD